MADRRSVLLVDSIPSDRGVAALVLERSLPDFILIAPTDPLSLADGINASPDVAIIAADVTWAAVADLIAAIKRRTPRTRLVVLGSDADIASRVLEPGLACDGIVRKSSAGFLALGAITAEVLARGRPTATESAPQNLAEPRAQDMRDMAFVLSHDLREPMQQIVRLARSGHVDASRDVTLRRVLECAQRADDMLDRMVEYLKVAADKAPRPVDLNVCLQRALNNLRSTIDECGADIRVDALPQILGDEYQTVHVFQNLIANALKFRRRERPILRVDAEARGSHWLLTFRDNGIGIPAGRTEEIFALGKRLHTRDEYPGSGIGLALCRRIVERQGGRIWADSDGQHGSTFFVLLPRVDADAAEAADGVDGSPTVPGVA